MTITTLDPSAKAGLEIKYINGVVHIASRNLFVYTVSHDPKIWIFHGSAAGEPIHVFDKHRAPDVSRRCVHVVHQFDDVVCSVDDSGYLFTCNASSGLVLESFEGPET